MDHRDCVHLPADVARQLALLGRAFVESVEAAGDTDPDHPENMAEVRRCMETVEEAIRQRDRAARQANWRNN